MKKFLFILIAAALAAPVSAQDNPQASPAGQSAAAKTMKKDSARKAAAKERAPEKEPAAEKGMWAEKRAEKKGKKSKKWRQDKMAERGGAAAVGIPNWDKPGTVPEGRPAAKGDKCIYEGKEYSEGAKICMNGAPRECSGGEWVHAVGPCPATPRQKK